MVIVCLVGSFLTTAQNILPSNTFIQTNYHNHDCFANGSASFLFYNELNHELNIVIDFSKCKVGHDSIDEWLDDIDDGKLYFKGIVKSEKLLDLTHSNVKSVEVVGKFKFNNVTVNDDIEITLFEISKEGMLYVNNGNDYYDRIRANVQLELVVKDFKIDKSKHKLKNTIKVNIGQGYINQFVPGMETWIKDN